MRVNANAVLRSWTLLAAFGGSYAPGYNQADNITGYLLFFELVGEHLANYSIESPYTRCIIIVADYANDIYTRHSCKYMYALKQTILYRLYSLYFQW